MPVLERWVCIFHVRLGLNRLRSRQWNFALAAIATALTTLAAMIRAGVLGAEYANIPGWLAANAARKDRCFHRHKRVIFLSWVGAG